MAFGDKLPKWVDAGVKEYLKRLSGASIQFRLVELPGARRRKTGNVAKWLEEEAKTFIGKLLPQDYLVILDVAGASISTEKLAARLQLWQENHSHIVILIGGSDGIDASIKARANESISLSRMTFPHALVRVILVEQLYRAVSILASHPYHK